MLRQHKKIEKYIYAFTALGLLNIAQAQEFILTGTDKRVYSFNTETDTTPHAISSAAPASLLSVAIKDTMAYMTGSNGNVYSLDLASPGAPLQINLTQAPTGLGSIFIRGDTAYMGCENGNVYTLNLATPSSPVQITTSAKPIEFGTFLQGSTAYLSGTDGNVYSLNISSPGIPVAISTGAVGTPLGGMYISDQLIYMVGDDGRIYSFDISSPGTPAAITPIAPLGIGIAVIEEMAYLAGTNGNIYTVNLASPGAPTVLNAIPAGTGFLGISLFSTLSPENNSIPTTGLTGNQLKIANYLNQNANFSTRALLDGLEGSSLKRALNSISPASNSYGAYVSSLSVLFLVNAFSNLPSVKLEQPEQEEGLLGMLLADASDAVRAPIKSKKSSNRLSFWISGFGEVARQSASHQNPAFNYTTEAVLAGLSYLGEKRSTVGGSLGYAHTHLSKDQNAGHGNIGYYLTSIYGNAYIRNFYFSPALWARGFSLKRLDR